MYAIEMSGISKWFGSFAANEKVDLKVKKGEIHCLLGENGAGKTTLMKVLFGLYHADECEVKVNGKVVHIPNSATAFEYGLGMVHQHFMLINNMTVLDNIILGNEGSKMKLNRKDALAKIEEIQKKYNFNLNLKQNVSELSVGMMQRAEILKTVYRGADILILDEPTAVLTPQEVESLLNILNDMRKEGKTIIFITHKLNETMKIADSVTVLRSGRTVASAVPISELTPEKMASLMVGREISLEVQKKLSKPGKEVLRLQDVKLLDNASNTIDLTIREGEILGIAGVDGNGQIQLEEGIVGLRKFSQGKIYYMGNDISHESVKKRRNIGIAHIPSDRLKRAVVANFSIEDNYLLGNQYRSKYCRKGIVDQKAVKSAAIEKLNSFQVKNTGLGQKIGDLSGGNQQKMVLSREVTENASLIIAAQPVRGLDIGAIENIHNILLALRDEGKAILLISSELSEIMQMSDKIAVIYKGEFMALKDASEYSQDEIGLLIAGRKGGDQDE